ncbi:hypothetical protein FHS67_002467 [Aminobacter aminovorans]|uniref:Uncharacterized protein n=1 Tax=Aminobacter aminovorans TaxID=83263 RepID=A0ABR6H6N5_AMIAI|nr:hypothetical protein [Aminobacter aminovorans]
MRGITQPGDDLVIAGSVARLDLMSDRHPGSSFSADRNIFLETESRTSEENIPLFPDRDFRRKVIGSGWSIWGAELSMSWWKTATVAVAALGSLLLVEVLSGGFDAVSGEYFLKQPAGRPSAEDVFSDLRSQGYRMYDTIKQELPEAYVALKSGMEAIAARSATAAEARDETLQAVVAVRRKHAQSIYRAPDDSLYPAIKSQLDLLELVDARETPATCASFVVSGGAALGRPDQHYLLAFDAIAADVFQAIGAARENPQPTEASTDADWEELYKTMTAQGATTDDIRSLTALDPRDENLCKVMKLFLRGILAVEAPGGRRLRAEIAYGIAVS